MSWKLREIVGRFLLGPCGKVPTHKESRMLTRSMMTRGPMSDVIHGGDVITLKKCFLS